MHSKYIGYSLELKLADLLVTGCDLCGGLQVHDKVRKSEKEEGGEITSYSLW